MTEHAGSHSVRMSAQGIHFYSGVRIPDLDRSIPRGGGNDWPVRVDGTVADGVRMPSQGPLFSRAG